MKLLVAAAALLIAVPALAQTSAPATPTTPAAPTTTPSTAAPAAAFGLDTPIATLADNPATRAVLEADIPGMLQHPAYEQFKVLSLNQLAPYSQGLLTADLLARVGAHLAAVH